MNILTGGLPCKFNNKYEIRTDFRDWCKFEQLMLDDEVSDMSKAPLAINLIFVDIPPADMFLDAFKFLQWFYNCGNEQKTTTSKSHKTIKRQYDYEIDSDYIYAAFLSQYNIDLIDIQYLHWWKFSALLRSLSDCKFTDIIGYRTTNITKDMPKERAEGLKKLKELYALPKTTTQKLKIAKMKEYYGR